MSYGPLLALDGPGQATLKLDGFEYYFNQFLLQLRLDVYGIVFGEWDGSWNPTLYTFDISDFTGGLHCGVHGGTTDTFEASFAIQNVAPTATIDLDDTHLVNGNPTFITHVGDPVHFSGRATDPGLDDLTLSWDWNDGLPAPDEVTSYLVPYDVTEAQTHVFADACAYDVHFKAVDDDGDFGEHIVTVIVTGSATTPARFEGYWMHQLRGNGNAGYDTDQIACSLEMIAHMSSYFDETRNVSNREQAFDVLFPKRNQGSEAERLERDLLIAWLNFASGAFDYLELLDTDHNERGDTPFFEVIDAAEAVLQDPAATEEELRHQTWILHHIKDMTSDGPATGRMVIRQ